MASSSAQRQVTTYKDITWYPSYTELEEEVNDTTLYAPSSSLLLSCHFTAEGGDAYYYTTFPSYLDMYKCVETYNGDTTHYLSEVLSTSRPRKLFISFTAPTEEKGMMVVRAFASALTTACLQAYSHYDDGMKRTVSFSPADIRIYQCGTFWRVVDNVRGYASARHVVHLQKTLYPFLAQQFSDVTFGNDAHLRLHLPITTPYLYGKGEEGEYKSLNKELNNELKSLQSYKTAAHGYVFSLSNRPTKELFDAGVMLDSYITSSEKMLKSLSHYCTPPNAFDDAALDIPYTYYRKCNAVKDDMYRQGDTIRHHGPWYCPICCEEHPAGRNVIMMDYIPSTERYRYFCMEPSRGTTDNIGCVYWPYADVSLPFSEEKYAEYLDSGVYPYPPTKAFHRDESGTRNFMSWEPGVVDLSDPATSGPVAVGTDRTNSSNSVSKQKWSQVIRPPVRPPSYPMRSKQAAQTRAYHDPTAFIPSIDYYLDNEHVYNDYAEKPNERHLLSDAGAIINALYGLTKLAEEVAYFYKLLGGNTIINWYTGEEVHVRKQLKVQIFLPSAYREAEEVAEETDKKMKNPKPMKITFSLKVLMSGDYYNLNQLNYQGLMEALEEEDPDAYIRAVQMQENLVLATMNWNDKRPRIPKNPNVTPFFFGDEIPLVHNLDVNMSKGFPCNPNNVADPTLDPRTRVETQFPTLRKLYLHGYCGGVPLKAHVLWSHEAYPLGHLLDPQTLKALCFGGPQGSLKTAYATILKAIYGESMVSVSPHQVCGKFNTALEGAIMVSLDEPSASNTRNYNDTGLYKDAMKKIIAGDGTLSIEGKGKNVYSVRNLCNVVISTNHYNTGLLDAEDKRRFILLATRCLGITKHGVLIVSDNESFTEPQNAETKEPVTLDEDDTVAMVKERFLEAYCEEVNQPNFVNEFARYLLDYGKVYDTSFIRSYVQPYDDAARAEMLNMTSSSCAEFFEDFLSDEYTPNTSLDECKLIERSPHGKLLTEGKRSYYIFTKPFYTEYVAWFKTKYQDGKPMREKVFISELTSWCNVNATRMSYHRDTVSKSNRIKDLRSNKDTNLNTGVQFISAAAYRLGDLPILPPPPKKEEEPRNEAPDVPSPLMKQSPSNIIPANKPFFEVPLVDDRYKKLEEENRDLRETVKSQGAKLDQMMQMMQQFFQRPNA